MRQAALALVIFDCDGVLVDSETLSRIVIADEARRLGWPLEPDDARCFTGLRWSDLQPIFESRIGRPLPEGWPLMVQDNLIKRMREHIAPVAGAADVLRATTSLGLPWRVASNSSHEEMAEKFTRTGLASLVQGRVHSARDVGRGKPAPDVFLAAAAAEGVEPEACIVVEDSAPGIAAARAAGMRCVAFAAEPGHAPAGATMATVRRLAELPILFRAAMVERAA